MTSAEANAACEGLELRVLDVGQGDAILLRDGGEVALIDAGPSSRIVEHLQQLGVTRLAVFIASHNHEDHIGGADAVLAAFPVAEFIDNRFPEPSTSEHRLLALLASKSIPRSIPSERATIKLGKTVLHLLLPAFPGGDSQNNRSVVVLVEHARFTALLTGDAEVGELKALLKANAVPHVDVLKASHHGSRNGLTPLFLQRSKPEVVVISVGHDNGYGHPSPIALRYYAADNRRVFRTDANGDITVCALTGASYDVSPASRPAE